MANALIVIPARLQATRLPGKPLADIAGEAMVVHVWRRAMESRAGRVLVATDCENVRDAVEQAGGEAVITRGDHDSGTDRIHEAVQSADPGGQHEIIVNLQGDLPTLEPRLIAACIAPLEDGAADISTLAAPITDDHERADPHVVKAVGARTGEGRMRALYFTRATAPWGEGPLYHHIGIYAFRREALNRFVSLPRSDLERREKLEQLRALEAGMRIDVALVDTVPVGVDTPADLERARKILAG